MNRLRSTLLLALLLALLTPVSAVAATKHGKAATPSNAVDADCNAHLKLTKHYTAKQLKQALATMPADESEYTDCPDVIQRALNAELGKGGGGSSSSSGGGSSFPVWLIVVIVVVVAGGVAATVAARRRQDGAGGSGGAGDQ